MMRVGKLVAAAMVLLLGCGDDDSGEADGGAPVEDAAGGEDAGDDPDAASIAGDADPSPDASDGDSDSRVIFATSTTHAGDLGGPDGADAICDARASEAGLTGTFRAWLSSGEIDAPDRLDPAPGALVRTDGVTVVESWGDLLGGTLEAPINRDENDAQIGGDVWTGTLADGTSAEQHCEGFTAGGGSTGLCGNSGAIDGTWTENIVPGCGTALRLYCIEQ